MRFSELTAKDHFKSAVYPSPFHSRMEPLNRLKEWSRWGDYLSVPEYFCSSLEYFACRNTCGVFDLSSMVKHRITGADAEAFLNRLVIREVSKIKPGRV